MAETRSERRRRRHREALLTAAEELMIEKGPGAATVQEITHRADVALGTFYAHFYSKEAISNSVIEGILTATARQIREVTDTFDDTAQAFAYGVRTVMDIAVTDPRWRRMLQQPDSIADVWTSAFGPYGTTDIRRAVAARKYRVDDVNLVWTQAIWAMVAACLMVIRGGMTRRAASRLLDESTVNILCMVGVDRTAAKAIVARPMPRPVTIPAKSSDEAARPRRGKARTTGGPRRAPARRAS